MTDRTPLTYNGAVTGFRQRLLQGDAIAMDAVTDAYKPIREKLLKDIAALETDLSEVTSASDLYKLGRYRSLLNQIDEEIAQLAQQAGTVIVDGQQTFAGMASEEARTVAIATAAEQSATLAFQIGGAWTMLPREATRDLIGRLSDGSPLRDYLDGLPNQFGLAIRDELVKGITLGYHPRQIMRNVEERIDGQVARLLTTTRTAILDSYRSASIRAMAESGVVDEWMWTAAKDSRTCLACLALDGETFPVTTSFMPSHPGCRCAPRPLVRGLDKPQRETGAAWFDRQPENVKRQMLPNYAYEPYRNGQIGLRDFAHLDRDERWGNRYRVGSVKNKIGKAA